MRHLEGIRRLFRRRGNSVKEEPANQTLGPRPEEDFDPQNFPRCPYCQKDEVSRIIYGKPPLTRQVLEGLESGEIIAGGCLIHSGAPRWHCRSCRKDFDTPGGLGFFQRWRR